MQNRFVLFGLIILGCLALTGLIWVLVVAPPEIDPRTTVPGPVEPALNPIHKDLEIKESTGTYKISVKYPVFSDLKNEGVDASVNNLIQKEMERQVGEFKKQVSEMALRDFEYASTFDSGYEIVNQNRDMLSLNFSSYSYISGSAHGLGVISSLNYNLKENKPMALADLFRKDSSYLSFLSEKSRTILKDKMQEYYTEEFVISGTEPVAENYAVYNFGKDKLTLIFNVYQVAPYVAGPQSVDIPYEEMADIVNPEIVRVANGSD